VLKGILRPLLRPFARRWALRRLPPDLAAGDLYAIPTNDSRFAILKVLATDPQGVHVRLYKQRFSSVPSRLEASELTLGAFAVDETNSDPFTIGHLPITRISFGLSSPVRVARQPVLEDELEGYRIWLDSRGGYFEGRII
jgi:hypothetical protein